MVWKASSAFWGPVVPFAQTQRGKENSGEKETDVSLSEVDGTGSEVDVTGSRVKAKPLLA